METTDKEIYEKILQGNPDNTFLSDGVEILLREAKKFNLYTRAHYAAFIGIADVDHSLIS